MIKHLILDIGGVITYPKGFSNSSKQCMESKGILPDISKKIYRKYYREIDLSILPYSHFIDEYNKITTSEWTAPAFVDAILKCTEINSELIEFAKKISIPVSILSDNYPEYIAWLKKNILLDEWTHKQVISYEHGIGKPDPSIYTKLLELLGAKPEECIFVDNLKENVEAANELGIHGIQFIDNTGLFEDLKKFNLA